MVSLNLNCKVQFWHAGQWLGCQCPALDSALAPDPPALRFTLRGSWLASLGDLACVLSPWHLPCATLGCRRHRGAVSRQTEAFLWAEIEVTLKLQYTFSACEPASVCVRAWLAPGPPPFPLEHASSECSPEKGGLTGCGGPCPGDRLQPTFLCSACVQSITERMLGLC